MKVSRALWAALAVSAFMASCTPKVKHMETAEIQKAVRETLSQLDPKVTESLCEKEYRDLNMLGGCYAMAEEDDIVASGFYETMQKKGFTPGQRMRQDYQAWTGTLFTPDKTRSVSFNIRTVLDATRAMGVPYTAREMGYRTLVSITLWDAGKEN